MTSKATQTSIKSLAQIRQILNLSLLFVALLTIPFLEGKAHKEKIIPRTTNIIQIKSVMIRL